MFFFSFKYLKMSFKPYSTCISLYCCYCVCLIMLKLNFSHFYHDNKCNLKRVRFLLVLFPLFLLCAYFVSTLVPQMSKSRFLETQKFRTSTVDVSFEQKANMTLEKRPKNTHGRLGENWKRLILRAHTILHAKFFYVRNHFVRVEFSLKVSLFAKVK